MAQTKPTGLSIEDLKKSLKTLTSEMNPEQLKRANETLEKLESVTAKSNEDNVEIQKTNVKIEKHLSKNGDLNKTLLGLQKLYKDTQKEDLKYKNQSLAKLDRIGGGTGINKVGPIREDRALTLREQLKETVAGGKGAVSSIGRGIGAIGSGIRDVFTKPGEVFNKVKGKLASTYQSGKESIKDIASTKEDYDPRSERFEDRFVASKADQRKEQGSLLDPKLAARLDKNVAKVSYKKMLGAETELIETNKKISEFERSGLPVPKDLAKQKETLEKTHKESDVRSTFAPVATKGKPTGAAEKANEAAEKSSIDATKKARDENPEGDNVVSANEKMADSLKELTQTSKELLSTTKESVEILKSIKQDLASDDIKPLESKGGGTSAGGTAPAEASVTGSSGPGIGDAVDLAGDLLDKGKGKPGGGFPRGKPSIPGKPSMGGKILGGLKSAGPGLLKGGIAALGGAALSYGGEKLKESGHEKLGAAADIAGEAASWGGTGAMIGSVIPGVGTAIGGAIGAVGGAGYGLYKNYDTLFGGKDTPELPSSINAPSTGASGFPLKGEGPKGGLDPNDSDVAEYRRDVEDVKNPAKITRTIASNNADPADPKVRAQIEAEQKSYTETPEGRAKFAKMMSGAETFAKGGPVKGGGAENGADYIVGEEGPELFVPFKDGVVIPNDVSQKLAPAAIKGGIRGLAEGGIAFDDLSKEAQFLQKAMMDKNTRDKLMPDNEGGNVYSYKDPKIKEYEVKRDQQMEEVTKLLKEQRPEEYSQVMSNLAPSKSTTNYDDLRNISDENENIKNEMSAKGGSSQPIIMNNSSNNSETKIVPMKADPRPSDRGSAFERHVERTSAY